MTVRLIVEGHELSTLKKVIYIKNDYTLCYDAIDENTSGELFLIYDTLTIAFCGTSKEFVSLDAYTNMQFWKYANEINIPKISKVGCLKVIQGLDEEDDRVSFQFEPIYEYSNEGTLRIRLSYDQDDDFFQISSEMIVGLNKQKLTSIIFPKIYFT